MTKPPNDVRWPIWRLALLLYPFAATAVAINVFMIGLIGLSVGLPSLSPVAALGAGALLGVPAAAGPPAVSEPSWTRPRADSCPRPVLPVDPAAASLRCCAPLAFPASVLAECGERRRLL